MIKVFGRGRLAAALTHGLAQADLVSSRDIFIDAGSSRSMAEAIEDCRASRRRPVFIECRSNISEDDLRRLSALSLRVLVVLAPNLSILSIAMARCVTAICRTIADNPIPIGHVAIDERHPLSKKDAPSRTAQRLASLWNAEAAQATRTPEVSPTYRREGAPVADHIFVLEARGETLRIEHSTLDLEPVVLGGLTALVDRVDHLPGCGVFAVEDVLA